MDVFDIKHGGPESGYLTGQLLIAMPTMRDPRFEKSVIYMCVHNAEGAVGLVLNRQIESITFPDLLKQLNIEPADSAPNLPIHFGGPVETGRGFVLHSADYGQTGTIMVGDMVGLTATVDILKDMAAHRGPKNSLLALGYAGWGPGQLDGEIQQNAWLNVPADEGLIFDSGIDTKWARAIAKIGIDPSLLSGDAGHA
ncbi:MAG: YqgE/AlgH family protein [Alphaproteobacteria bacterium]